MAAAAEAEVAVWITGLCNPLRIPVGWDLLVQLMTNQSATMIRADPETLPFHPTLLLLLSTWLLPARHRMVPSTR